MVTFDAKMLKKPTAPADFTKSKQLTPPEPSITPQGKGYRSFSASCLVFKIGLSK